MDYMRLFFFSLLVLAHNGSAQFVNQLSLDGVRIGIDPIKSWSLLARAERHTNRPVFFNTTEGFVELQVHERTSVVVEGGYSSSNWNRFANTYIYNSKGYFARIGFDFDVFDPDPDYEVDVGWRIGVNTFRETGRVNLHGNYWNEDIRETPLNSMGSTYWGELIMDLKYRIFKNTRNRYLKNLWFNTSFRFRFKQKDLVSSGYSQYFMIPGYGPNSRYMGGVHFGLSYFIKIRERRIYTIHHLHDNRVLLKHR